MKKLLSVIVAAAFAAMSLSAFAASHAGAAMKDDQKTEKKAAKKGEKKKSAKKADKMSDKK